MSHAPTNPDPALSLSVARRVQRMREGGFNLGGEQSGHIVMTDYATTGDGLMAGLQFLSEMMPRTNRRARCSTASTRCRKF